MPSRREATPPKPPDLTYQDASSGPRETRQPPLFRGLLADVEQVAHHLKAGAGEGAQPAAVAAVSGAASPAPQQHADGHHQPGATTTKNDTRQSES